MVCETSPWPFYTGCLQLCPFFTLSAMAVTRLNAASLDVLLLEDCAHDGQAQARKSSAQHPKPENAPVFKGVTWSATNGQWRAQAWDGKRVRLAIDSSRACSDRHADSCKIQHLQCSNWKGNNTRDSKREVALRVVVQASSC